MFNNDFNSFLIPWLEEDLMHKFCWACHRLCFVLRLDLGEQIYVTFVLSGV